MQKNAPTYLMNGFGDALPTGDLVGGENSRTVDVAIAEGIHHGAFRYDLACGCPLGVILGHQGLGNTVDGAQPRHGGHDDPIGKIVRAEACWREESIVGIHSSIGILSVVGSSMMPRRY